MEAFKLPPPSRKPIFNQVWLEFSRESFCELRLYLLRESQKENLNAFRRNFMEFSQLPVTDLHTFDRFPNLFDESAFLAIERIDLDPHLFCYLPRFQLLELQLNQ